MSHLDPHALNPVSTGIDIMRRDDFAALQGKSVGLITNHTGLDRDGSSTIDLLHQATGVRLTALFSPEHGLRGQLDDRVGDSMDPATGLPVYSLYGQRMRPAADQLTGLDTLVFDIQDVGSRFYTYSSTLGYCLEAASEHHLHYVVLDRPNPIDGVHVEGPIADSDRLSFTAYHTVPVRHGMTFGELAIMYNAEKQLSADLRVIAVEGWRRSDLWDSTNLTWVHPSPNMRSLTEALLYPGICLLEPTNVSVGRGTDTPFELLGAPWIDGRRLAAELNARELPGITFIPVRFTPASSVHRGAECGGINIQITSRARLTPTTAGMAIADTLLRLYPAAWASANFDRLLVNRASFGGFLAGETAEQLAAVWRRGEAAFQRRRKRFLLYE